MKMNNRIVRTDISSAITSGYSRMSVRTSTGRPDILEEVSERRSLW